MSAQHSGSASVPRPTANGVGAGGMTSSQQRTDSQAGPSTTTGQSGSMSQSNLNNIVRDKNSLLILSAFCLSEETIICPKFVKSVPKKNPVFRFRQESVRFKGEAGPLSGSCSAQNK